MNRVLSSIFYAVLLTASIEGFGFLPGLLWTMAEHGDTSQYALQMIVGGFIVCIFASVGIYEFQTYLDARNEEGRKRMEERERQEQLEAKKRQEERDRTKK